MNNSRVQVLNPYPVVNQVNEERFVSPLPEPHKPVLLVPPCLGCGKLPHPDELNCLRRAVRSLLAQRECNVNHAAELAYNAYATFTFGVPPGPLPKQGKESGRTPQSCPAEWDRLPDVFREKWREVMRRIL